MTRNAPTIRSPMPPKGKRYLMPSDPHKRTAYECRCGEKVLLCVDEVLPKGWSVKIVQAMSRGKKVFRGWRYMCPSCNRKARQRARRP